MTTSKTGLMKRIETLEQKNGSPDKIIVLHMWCPGGKTTHPNSRRFRIEPSNPEDAKL